MKKRFFVFSALLSLVVTGCTPGSGGKKELQLKIDDPMFGDYKVGDVFDDYVCKDGLNVKVFYEDNSSKTLEKNDFTYKVSKSSKEYKGTDPFEESGLYTVTVSRNDLKPSSYSISVKDVTKLTKIEASDYTNTVVQDEDWEFDGKVTATFSDSTTKDVTSKCDISELDTSKVGPQEVNISYTENKVTKTTSILIDVEEKQSEDAYLTEINASGYSTQVYQGDPYTFDGIVTAYYSDKSSKTVTKSCSIGTISTSRLGNQTLTISYTDKITKTLRLTISVVEKPSSIVNVTGVNLGKTSTTIKVGNNEQLTYEVLPQNATNKTVSFTSSNPSVASVTNSGLVTGIKEGTTSVTVKTVDGNFTKSCAVTVEKQAESQTITPAQAISLMDSAGTGNVVKPEYSVKGVVEDVVAGKYGFSGSFKGTSMVFVDAKGNGLASDETDLEGKEVTIFGYLELYNGKYQIGYLPANISPTGSAYNPKITAIGGGVTPDVVHVTSVSLNATSKKLEVGKVASLVETVLPSNATNKTVTWESSKPAVASVSDGVITAIAVGTTVITVKTVDQGKTATCSIEVTSSGDTPVTDTYKLGFNTSSSDSGTELTSSSFFDTISEGSNLISSVSYVVKVFQGIEGLKFGSNKASGSLSLVASNVLKNVECSKVTLELVKYGSSTSNVELTVNDVSCGTHSSSDGIVSYDLSGATSIESINISGTNKFYLKSITFDCKPSTPISPTAISLPSTKALSLNQQDTLVVSYTPSNCNTNKGVTWKSSNSNVVSVNNGVIKGLAEGTAKITATSTYNQLLVAECSVTVSRIAVTGVSLNQTTASISKGNTLQLTATVAPSNASNKAVTWSSSANGVATVNSDGLVSAVGVGSATITVKTSDGNKSASCSVQVNEITGAAWTILIYMCGADLESGYAARNKGYATSDLKEIASIDGQPNNVNVVVEAGGASAWSSTYSSVIKADKLNRFHLSGKTYVKDSQITIDDMGEMDTFQSFLEWGINTYPADKIGVIMWNHGGAMDGVCFDENYETDESLSSLTSDEVSTAAKNAIKNTNYGKKLEFIGYDACLMSVQDIAGLNAPYFNYMIASEESEDGAGWNYDEWMNKIFEGKSTEDALTACVDSFIAEQGSSSDQTLSWLRLNNFSNYQTKFESLANYLNSNIVTNSSKWSTFSKVVNKAKKYGYYDESWALNYNNGYLYDIFDVQDFFDKMQADTTYKSNSTLQGYISECETALSSVIGYEKHGTGAGNSHGLCMFCPISGYNEIDSCYKTSMTSFTTWRSFVKTYGNWY